MWLKMIQILQEKLIRVKELSLTISFGSSNKAREDKQLLEYVFFTKVKGI